MEYLGDIVSPNSFKKQTNKNKTSNNNNNKQEREREKRKRKEHTPDLIKSATHILVHTHSFPYHTRANARMRTVNTDSHSRTHVRTHTHIHTQHELPLLLFHSFINRSVQLPILTCAELKADFNTSDTFLFCRDELQEKHSVSGSLSWRWRGHYCACQVRVNFYRVMSLVRVLCNITQIYYNHNTYKGTRN